MHSPYRLVIFLQITHDKTPIACPWGRGMGVFCEFEVWPKFCLWSCCAVCNNELYGTAIYLEAIVSIWCDNVQGIDQTMASQRHSIPHFHSESQVCFVRIFLENLPCYKEVHLYTYKGPNPKWAFGRIKGNSNVGTMSLCIMPCVLICHHNKHLLFMIWLVLVFIFFGMI